MSDAAVKPASRELPRRTQSIYRVHYALPRESRERLRPVDMYKRAERCVELQVYGSQVAGHNNQDVSNYTGLLQCSSGTILKPILKASQRREVEFYEALWASTDCADLLELRRLSPQYFGSRRLACRGADREYIILEDLTHRMLQPCIMDVKIGRRTWDPLASEAKIKSEESKYTLSKQEFGFCIPGYQVYKVSSGKLCRYNKEHGKKLAGQRVVDAIKNFLNGMGAPMSRSLVLSLLGELWRLQRWAARQLRLRLYSASLLLVYDATKTLGPESKLRTTPAVRRKSVPAMHNQTSFSGQLSPKGPIYKKVNSVPLVPMSLQQATFSSPPSIQSPWTEALEKIENNHSFEHNYEDKLCKMRMNYQTMLDELCSDTPTPNPLGTVKIIDFAHAFFNDEDDKSIDTNFKTGIDNLVSIFEKFLKETDDQVL